MLNAISLTLYSLMALILSLETATEICSVALSQNGETVLCKQIAEGNKHASHLHLLVQEIIDEVNISFADLNAVCISMGPGSYTGLRVGVSAAKGFCYALNIPLIAINTLASLSIGFAKSNAIVNNSYLVPMIDARRMEVYTAVYSNNFSLLEPTNAKIIDSTSFSNLNSDYVFYFFGNGAEKCKTELSHLNAIFKNYFCSAENLSELAYKAYLNKDFVDIAYFEPFYLKDFVGTQPKKIIT